MLTSIRMNSIYMSIVTIKMVLYGTPEPDQIARREKKSIFKQEETSSRTSLMLGDPWLGKCLMNSFILRWKDSVFCSLIRVQSHYPNCMLFALTIEQRVKPRLPV